ncbi:MAG: hypothetical protein BMS9Abin33_0717 [Gammaproteobacteria bacterium]|nr:MAG: hypothetical protein BMS9Abin33_0717 [Gammaproteobacteria bacterium]
MNKIRYRIYLIALLLMAPITVPVQAEDNSTVILLQFDIAEKSIEHLYKGIEPGGNKSDAKFSGNLSSAIYGIGIAKNRFYANLSLEQTLRSDNSYKPETGGFLDISRNDQSLTLGYSVSKMATLFLGYKRGATLASGLSVDPDNIIPATPNSLEFVEIGPYIGGNINFSINDTNLIGLSLAYADMDGEINNKIDKAGGAGSGPASAEGTADGFSLGLKWTRTVSAQTNLNIGLKFYRYKTKATDLNNLPTSFDSDYMYFTVGLNYLL